MPKNNTTNQKNGYTLEYRAFRARLRPRKMSGKVTGHLIDLACPDGRRSRILIPTTDTKTAEIEFAKWGRQVLPGLAGQFDDGKREADIGPRIHTLVTHYLESYLPARNATESTVSRMTYILQDFERFCAAKHIGRTSQLTPSIVDEWSASLLRAGRAAKTVHNSITALRACLNAAVARDVIPASPIRKWLMPTVPESEIEPLTPEELRRVLEIIAAEAPRIAPITRWMAYTGQRPSDASGLLWANVDVSRGIVTRLQVKTKRLATFELSKEAMMVLAGERAKPEYNPAGHVFLSSRGGPFAVDTLYNEFTRALRRARFPRQVNLKDLRHTFGSILANEMRCPLPILQRLMGHSRIETTLKYVKPGTGTEYVQGLGELISAHSPQVTESTGHRGIFGTAKKKGRKS